MNITCRKARLTYGTLTNTPYNGSYPEHRDRSRNAKTVQGKLLLETFYCFVERGEDLRVDTERVRTFTPLAEDQQWVSFPIAVSKRRAADIRYLKDEGVERTLSTIITVRVPLDRTVPLIDRGVSVRLVFGGTELHIVCKRCADGHEVPAKTIVVENMDDYTDETVA